MTDPSSVSTVNKHSGSFIEEMARKIDSDLVQRDGLTDNQRAVVKARLCPGCIRLIVFLDTQDTHMC